MKCGKNKINLWCLQSIHVDVQDMKWKWKDAYVECGLNARLDAGHPQNSGNLRKALFWEV